MRYRATGRALLLAGVLCTALFGGGRDADAIAGLNGKVVAHRPIEVATVTADALGGCHLLYLDGLDGAAAIAVLRAVAGRTVLTVGSDPDFSAEGGMVEFVPANDRIGFQINVDAVAKNGLMMSSKLLNLAQIVHGP